MKKFIDFFRAFFISAEFATLAVALALKSVTTNILKNYANDFLFAPKVSDYFIALPLGLLAWVSRDYFGILFPGERTNAILQKWPDFFMLKNRLVVSLLFCICSVIICICSISYKPWPLENRIYWFLIGTIVELIVVGSIYFAKITIKEILLRVEK